MEADGQTAAQGSSPRIRGKLSMLMALSVLSVDHPREYGENAANPADWAAVAGSSPRIRGK